MEQRFFTCKHISFEICFEQQSILISTGNPRKLCLEIPFQRTPTRNDVDRLYRLYCMGKVKGKHEVRQKIRDALGV